MPWLCQESRITALCRTLWILGTRGISPQLFWIVLLIFCIVQPRHSPPSLWQAWHGALTTNKKIGGHWTCGIGNKATLSSWNSSKVPTCKWFQVCFRQIKQSVTPRQSYATCPHVMLYWVDLEVIIISHWWIECNKWWCLFTFHRNKYSIK